MSVLARPQGWPERVWSYVAGLEALGGSAEREQIEALINPGYLKDGAKVHTAATMAGDIFGAARSLALITQDRQRVTLCDGVETSDFEVFADALHDRFASPAADDTNRVMFETYAWFVAESDRQGHLAWLTELSNPQLADAAIQGLRGEDEDGRPMNPTKLVAWRRWMGRLGLMIDLPLTKAPDHPHATARTARELARGGLAPGDRLTHREFLRRLVERQPYFDTGRLFVQACARMDHTPKPDRLSPLLSATLRDLHDDGRIQLELPGDSGDGLTLTGAEDHEVTNFNNVTIKRLGAAS